jgi:D-psicose/D-tagatose/L-ribulose 3-epimerase
MIPMEDSQSGKTYNSGRRSHRVGTYRRYAPKFGRDKESLGNMKIGISAFAWTARFDRSHLQLLPFVKGIGLSAVEVPMFDPAALPVESIRAGFAAQDLDCTVCAILPREFNPISPDAHVRREAILHLTRCIQTAAAMGCKLLAGPLFSPIGYLPDHRPTKQEWSWAVETFRALADVLEENDINIAIEPVNRSETFFLRTGSEAKRLCEEIGNPRIGVTIDTFHANIEEQNISNAIRSLGPHLRHIHASENDRGPLGRGHVPFAEIISALKTVRYDGYLMIEGFGYDPKETNAPGSLWASTEVSPEALASESYRYLSQVLARSLSE